MDKHYWKDAYQHLWETASKKEDFIKKLIEQETGYAVQLSGMGAGTSSYIKGNASDNNCEMGDADLYIPKADAYAEVTGPNIKMELSSALWFRPDKLRNAYRKLTSNIGKNHFLIHVQEVKGSRTTLIRVVHLNRDFFKRLIDKEFHLVCPVIRTRHEEYYEIPATSNVISTFQQLIKMIKTHEEKS
jgi:hypothetical protein